ncbi:metal-sensitive transcriptional regulator [Propionispora sp. 2/2-37]|uniref:metal-sensitive transcriptional regulator n=1 Tax=Propionispora sp. 2/2-37 TaxID=1677858 RepID=UPI0006BB5B26|nr:metal-sensitive transcriptional regulator [Propionispora sp. 2/2-37]
MSSQNVKTEVLNRLRNVKGHVTGIERMVEENQPCSSVLIQLSAIRASIEKIGMYILENNAVECLCDKKHLPDDKQKIEQIVKQMLSFLK